MISVLSAIVLMVAIGTVIQRADLLSDYLGDTPTVTLNTDVVDARANRLLRIDVLSNDEGITEADRGRLALIGEPTCGQVFIQGQALQYLPDSSCVGQQTIQYGIQGKEESVGQVIAQMVGANGTAPQPSEPQVAAADTVPEQRVAAQASQPVAVEPETEPAQAEMTVASVEEVATPLPAAGEPASKGVVDALISGAAQQANAATNQVPTAAISATNAGQPTEEVILAEPVLPKIAAATLGTPRTPEVEVALAPQRAAQRVRRAQSGAALATSATPQAAGIEKPLIRLGTPTLDVRPPEEQQSVPIDDQVDLAAFTGAEGSPDRMGAVSTAREIEDSGDSGFLVAVIARQEPNTKAPEGLALSLSSNEPSASSVVNSAGRDVAGTRVALRSPIQIIGLPDAELTAALPSSPVDTSQSIFEPTPVVTSTPPRSKPLLATAGDATAPVKPADASQSSVSGDRDAPQSPAVPSSDQLAALPRHDAPCVIPPAMTIDVRRAARSIITIDAPCHADTVAELEYSSLRIAVPLDAKGSGSQMVLGFEPNAPALLSFVNGETIDFDLPFKGIGRVSRVALVWEMPVNLELNAIEFGAASGSPQHVRPDNPRRFEDVRRSGGGFLNTFRSYAGIGQNAQIYSFWHRRGGQQGVVELMIDYASRNRDLLDGTCGDGRYSTPNFLILRSEDARLERPVIRKLAALDCSRVVEEKGDKRLISGAVSDLLVVQR